MNIYLNKDDLQNYKYVRSDFCSTVNVYLTGFDTKLACTSVGHQHVKISNYYSGLQ